MKLAVSSLFLVLSVCATCDGARILLLDPVATKSHKMAYMPIIEGLAEKGHQLTVLTPFPPLKNVTNIREIVISNMMDKVLEDDVDVFMLRKLPGVLLLFGQMWIMGDLLGLQYSSMTQIPEFKPLLEEKFDLIMVDAIFNDFALPIADTFKVPIITISASEGPPWILANLGVPLDIASVPSTFSHYDDQMTLYQRFMHTLEMMAALKFREWILLPHLNSLVKRDFPNARTIQEVEKDISLCIVSTHPSLNWPRPFTPAVVDISALHIKPPQPLPKVDISN